MKKLNLHLSNRHIFRSQKKELKRQKSLNIHFEDFTTKHWMWLTRSNYVWQQFEFFHRKMLFEDFFFFSDIRLWRFKKSLKLGLSFKTLKRFFGEKSFCYSTWWVAQICDLNSVCVWVGGCVRVCVWERERERVSILFGRLKIELQNTYLDSKLFILRWTELSCRLSQKEIFSLIFFLRLFKIYIFSQNLSLLDKFNNGVKISWKFHFSFLVFFCFVFCVVK